MKIDKISGKRANLIRELVNNFVGRLKHEYELSEKDIIKLLCMAEEKLARKEVLMSVTIYHNKELSALETSCKYLKEELDLSYHQIGMLLNRDDRTIWTTFNPKQLLCIL
jgi:hypothetical protein